MPTVTALRAGRGGRVAVDLDGRPWRTLPVDVVARAGLSVGLELDRPRLRDLRRELRRTRAVGTAVRALARSDRSEAELDARLERAGFAQQERTEALGHLRQEGLANDVRFAERRAEILAERGYGDAVISFDLERNGIAAEAIEQAIAPLEPETARAVRAARGRGTGPAMLRFLARRGFGEDAIEAIGDSAVADRG